MTTLDHLEIVTECASVLRAEHSGWSALGDRIANAECYLWRIHSDMPEQAAALAADIRANLTDYSEETGLSPDRLRWMANRLDGRLYSPEAA